MHAFTKLFVVLSSFEAHVKERHDSKGITAIEYAVMAAAIVAIIVTAVALLGDKINGLFEGISVSEATDPA